MQREHSCRKLRLCFFITFSKISNIGRIFREKVYCEKNVCFNRYHPDYSFAALCMLQFMPGSPFNDEKLSEAQVQVLNQKYGLDQPIVVQFVNYVKNVVKGDFGVSYSISKNTDISSSEHKTSGQFPDWRTGGCIWSNFRILLGIVAALKSGTWIDSVCTVISVFRVSLPSYVFALAMAYFSGIPGKYFPLLYDSAEAFASSVMPTIALAMFSITTVARFTRTELLEVLDQRLHASGRKQRNYRRAADRKTRASKCTDSDHHRSCAAGCRSDDWLSGNRKIFSIPGIGSLMVTAFDRTI